MSSGAARKSFASQAGTSAAFTAYPTRDFGFLPIPRRLQYDPTRPPRLSLFVNIIFGITSTFIMANLYYSQPLLIQLAKSFNVSYDEISRSVCILFALYGTGLLLISPLGDLMRRRPLLLLVVALACLLSIGLATSNSLIAFEVLSYFIGVVSIAPQILIPFVADLAPPARRASAISIVMSGLLLGVLVSRVMSGVVAQFVSWRVVYFVAVGIQSLAFLALWAACPDFPPANPNLSYFDTHRSMLKLALTEPTLVQVSLINFGGAASFTAFWVTLTFLLGDDPYNYDTIVIGLFGLIGMIGVFAAPLYGHMIDRLVPWYTAVASTILFLVAKALYLGAAGLSIAIPVLVTVGLDVGRQSQQISLSTSIFALDNGMRARLNAVSIFAIFLGQVVGSAVGARVFLHGGWRAEGGLMVGFCAFQLLVLLMRGPHVRRYTWLGYEGGLEWRRHPHNAPSPDVDAVPADAAGKVEEDDQAERGERAPIGLPGSCAAEKADFSPEVQTRVASPADEDSKTLALHGDQ
ncbi:major facilitator superfamily domain-containing protein [Vararia minispora EC-137]|uniref:Major facilitator superfamily domain-containing protein n=1 Tax=Vararia minispora EC-137 TaxID=1314806 RepID=A0ACB8QBM7_9AGAM|nr:major facilitator superfamily domain-containing protein [Vararia minispora EC-137]